MIRFWRSLAASRFLPAIVIVTLTLVALLVLAAGGAVADEYNYRY